MEVTAVSAVTLFVAAPLTISGYSHAKDWFRSSARRLAETPALVKDAFNTPMEQLRTANRSLGGHVTLSMDGRVTGSYVFFNGEILLVGDGPGDLKAVAALGGARVNSEAEKVSVQIREVPRELVLHFSNEQEAAMWARQLCEAASLPFYPERLQSLREHLSSQEMHMKDLQGLVDRVRKERDQLQKRLDSATHVAKIKELEEKIQDADLSSSRHQKRAVEAEAKLQEHEQRSAELQRLVSQAKGGQAQGSRAAGSEECLYVVDSGHDQHKANHPGLAYRLAMHLGEKDRDVAKWGTMVAGRDMGNGWLQVNDRFLPMAVEGRQVLRRHGTESTEDALTVQSASPVAAPAAAELQPRAPSGGLLAVLGDTEELAEQALADAPQAKQAPLLKRFVVQVQRVKRVLKQVSGEGSAEECQQVEEVKEGEEYEELLEMLEGRRAELEDRAAELERRMEEFEPVVIQQAEATRHIDLARSVAAAEARREALEERAAELEKRALAAQDGALQDSGMLQMLEAAEAQRERLEERARSLEQLLLQAELQADQALTGREAALAGETREGELKAMLQRVAEAEAKASMLQDAVFEKEEFQAKASATIENLRAEVLAYRQRVENAEADQQAFSQRGVEAESISVQLSALPGAAAQPAAGKAGQAEEAKEAELKAVLARLATAEAQASILQEEASAAQLDKERIQAGSAAAVEHLQQELAALRRAADEAADRAEAEKQVGAEPTRFQELADAEAKAADAEARSAQLQFLIEGRDRQIIQLEAAAAEMEQAHLQLATAAEAGTKERDDVAAERQLRIEKLEARAAALSEDLQSAQRELQTRAVEAPRELEAPQATGAAELQALCDERGLRIVHLEALLANSQEEALLQRVKEAEANVVQLQAAADEKHQQNLNLSEGIVALEEEIQQLRVVQATPGKDQAFQRQTSVDARVAALQALVEEKEQQNSALTAELKALEQDRAVEQQAAFETKVEGLQALVEEKDNQISMLTAELKTAQQDQVLQQQASVAAKVEAFQALAEEKDRQNSVLTAELTALEQDSALQRASAEAKVGELQALVEETQRQNAMLTAELKTLEQDQTLHQRAATAEDLVTQLQTSVQAKDQELLQQAADAGAQAEALQALVEERDRENAALAAELRALQQDQTHLQRATTAEELVAQLQLSIQEKDQAMLQQSASVDTKVGTFEALAAEKERQNAFLAAQLQTMEQDQEALLKRAADAEGRLLQLKASAKEQEAAMLNRVTEAEELLVQLQAAAQEKDLVLQRALDAEERLAALEALQEEKEREGQDESVLQRAMDAEAKVDMLQAKAQMLQVLVEEKERQNERLVADLSNMDQASPASRNAQPHGAALTAGSREAEEVLVRQTAEWQAKEQQLLERAEAAEAAAAQLTEELEEKGRMNLQLAAGVTAMEQEMEELYAAQAQGSQQSAAVEELTHRASDAETRVLQLQAMVNERDQQNRQLARGVADMDQEIAQLRAAASREVEVVREPQPSVAEVEELTQRASAAEARAAELQVVAEERDEQLSRLSAVVAEAEQELAARSRAADQREAELQSLADSRQQELTLRAADAEARLERLQILSQSQEQQILQLQEASAVNAGQQERELQLREAADEREQQLSRLRAEAAQEQEALVQRAVDAENRAVQLQTMADDRSRRVAELEASATAGQDHFQRAQDAEAKAAQLQELMFDQGAQIERLTAAAEEAEKAYQQRLSDAEAKALDAQEKDLQIARLTTAAQAQAQELQQQATVAAKVREFQALVEEKDRQHSLLTAELKTLEQDHARQHASVEAKVEELQVSVVEKERQNTLLTAEMKTLEQEILQLRAVTSQRAENDKAGKDALLEQAKEAEALLRRAAEAEDHATQLRSMAGLQDQRIAQLESSLASMQEDHATQLGTMAGAKEKRIAQLESSLAAMQEDHAVQLGNVTGLKDQRIVQLEAKLATLQEELAQTRADRSDEGNSLLQQAADVEERAAQLQFMVNERDREIARLHNEVIGGAKQAQAGSGDAEKRALLQRATAAEAKVAQLSKVFEDEKSLLRRRLTEQFEAEYTEVRKQALLAERDVQAARQERDALARRVDEVSAGATAGRESAESFRQRLATAESNAAELSAKWQEAEQDLQSARQALQRQQQEAEALLAQRLQAKQEAENERAARRELAGEADQQAKRLSQLMAERTVMQGQLQEKSRGLEEVGSKVKFLEEALTSAGAMVDSASQERFVQRSVTNEAPAVAFVSQGQAACGAAVVKAGEQLPFASASPRLPFRGATGPALAEPVATQVQSMPPMVSTVTKSVQAPAPMRNGSTASRPNSPLRSLPAAVGAQVAMKTVSPAQSFVAPPLQPAAAVQGTASGAASPVSLQQREVLPFMVPTQIATASRSSPHGRRPPQEPVAPAAFAAATWAAGKAQPPVAMRPPAPVAVQSHSYGPPTAVPMTLSGATSAASVSAVAPPSPPLAFPPTSMAGAMARPRQSTGSMRVTLGATNSSDAGSRWRWSEQVQRSMAAASQTSPPSSRLHSHPSYVSDVDATVTSQVPTVLGQSVMLSHHSEASTLQGQPVSPCGGIVSSVSPVPTAGGGATAVATAQANLRPLSFDRVSSNVNPDLPTSPLSSFAGGTGL